tara:strand:- start:9098 stop:10501 length:1404 start_codon:yes stop_codon:yes gene_type:complete
VIAVSGRQRKNDATMGASRTTKPLTAHPAFPAIVALWFAALLGLGTFVVPPANFEGLVVGSGLADLIPAAAPPLGDTARIAISAVAALLGALLGLAIAARIRKLHDEPQASGEPAAPATDSPWLADGDDSLERDFAPEAPADEIGLADAPEGDAPGMVPTRLAGRRSMSSRDEPLAPPEASAEATETEQEAERIFQASEIDLGEAAEADPVGEEGVAAKEGAAEEIETPPGDEEDDDLQRFAADRLVAGLPRVIRGNFDDDPLEDWSRSETVEQEPDPEAGFAAMPEPAASEAEEVESEGPDFDAPERVEEAEYEELPPEPAARFDEELAPAPPAETGDWSPSARDMADEPSWAADSEAGGDDAGAGDVGVGGGPEAGTAPPDLSASSLSELVARFDAALAAQRSRFSSDPAVPAQEQPDDPVIAFLRREADRDRGGAGEPRDQRSDDPRAGLRSALDKLDRVSRNS